MPPSWTTNGILTIVAGLLLPVVLVPITAFIDGSEVLEELAKGLVILFLILPAKDGAPRLLMGAGLGLLFGLSESLLYLNQIIQSGDISTFWQRLLLTVPMHIVTALLMTFGGLRGKLGLVLATASAILLHLAFNGFVAGMVVG